MLAPAEISQLVDLFGRKYDQHRRTGTCDHQMALRSARRANAKAQPAAEMPYE